MGRLKRALADLRLLHYMDAYLGWLLAVLVAGVEIVSAFGAPRGWVDTLVAATTVLLLGVIALATAEIRRAISEIPSAGGARLWRFFPDRDELPPLQQQMARSTRRVEIFGLQLGLIVHGLLPAVEERARAECRVRLALLSPVAENGTPILWVTPLGSVHDCPNLDEVLRTNLRQLRHWHTNLPPQIRRYVEIRAYTSIPTASVMLFDADRNGGYAHVEPILHAFPTAVRPSFWIREADHSRLFHLLVSHYRQVWESAIPLADLAL